VRDCRPFCDEQQGKKRGQRKTNAERDGTKRNEPNKTKFFLFFVGWQEEKRKTNKNFLFPVAGDELLSLISSSNIFNCV
jgi:hypothetical protein